jgi:hypothetical protein
VSRQNSHPIPHLLLCFALMAAAYALHAYVGSYALVSLQVGLPRLIEAVLYCVGGGGGGMEEGVLATWATWIEYA